MEEQSFISQLNKKKPQAFRILFNTYCRALILYAMDFNIKQDAAEDIVQDIFVRIYEGSSTFPNMEALRSFLYTSVRNHCLNLLKHEKIRQNYVQKFNPEEEEAAGQEEIELKMLKEEVYRRIFTILETLPPQCRKIFELHLQGMKNESIAGMLELSVHTVKTQKKRAMKQLREQLGDFYVLFLLFRLFP